MTIQYQANDHNQVRIVHGQIELDESHTKLLKNYQNVLKATVTFNLSNQSKKNS